MRQNIFMGGGPFGGAELGQVSQRDLDRKKAECDTLYTRYVDCLGRKRYSDCPDERKAYDVCEKQYEAMKARQRSAPSNYQWRTQPAQSNYQWNRTMRPSTPISTTTPTSQPAANPGSEVACYFCPNLPGRPTYWMSADQAQQWNSQYTAGCTKVKSKECQEKYGQTRATQTARQRVTSSLVSQYANPYGSAMTGLRVQNPGLLG